MIHFFVQIEGSKLFSNVEDIYTVNLAFWMANLSGIVENVSNLYFLSLLNLATKKWWKHDLKVYGSYKLTWVAGSKLWAWYFLGIKSARENFLSIFMPLHHQKLTALSCLSWLLHRLLWLTKHVEVYILVAELYMYFSYPLTWCTKIEKMWFWCHIDILFVEKKSKKRTRAKRVFIDVSEGRI